MSGSKGWNNRLLAGVSGRMMRRRVAASVALVVFTVNTLFLPLIPAEAQEALLLPPPGQRVELSQPFQPPILKGVQVYADNPFKLDFILDKGEKSLLPEETQRLIKYFLAALAVPEKDMWVNLSPYEKDRIVPAEFGRTDMGRDLLAQDYLLKQITSSVMYPEGEIGKKFWARVYQAAYEKYGTTDIPVDTFNKVWIVPEYAKVYEHEDTAFVLKARLKVMLETDYLATSTNAGMAGPQAGAAQKASQGNPLPPGKDENNIARNITREIVIPQLEKDVNEGANFAPLRQVYYSLILALWFKKHMHDGVLGRHYVDQKKITGIERMKRASGAASIRPDPLEEISPEMIYRQYLAAFRKGVYNFIKEENDPRTNTMIPRKYFSGGFTADAAAAVIDYSQKTDAAELGDRSGPQHFAAVSVDLSPGVDPVRVETGQKRREFFRTALIGTVLAAIGAGSWKLYMSMVSMARNARPAASDPAAMAFVPRSIKYTAALAGVIGLIGLGELYLLRQVDYQENMILFDLTSGKHSLGPELTEGKAVIEASRGEFWTDAVEMQACVIAVIIDQKGKMTAAHFFNVDAGKIDDQITGLVSQLGERPKKVTLFHYHSLMEPEVRKGFTDQKIAVTSYHQPMMGGHNWYFGIREENGQWDAVVAENKQFEGIALLKSEFKQQGEIFARTDNSMLTGQAEKRNTGGIDLTSGRMNVEVQSEALAADGPADVRTLENMEINQLYIMHIEIKPLENLPQRLGIAG